MGGEAITMTLKLEWQRTTQGLIIITIDHSLTVRQAPLAAAFSAELYVPMSEYPNGTGSGPTQVGQDNTAAVANTQNTV